jgi:hypothetical protein
MGSQEYVGPERDKQPVVNTTLTASERYFGIIVGILPTLFILSTSWTIKSFRQLVLLKFSSFIFLGGLIFEELTTEREE